MASVTRPSSLASRPLRSASIRSRGCGTWVNGVPVSSPIGLAVPWANTARMPLSMRPSTARSACSMRGDVVAPVHQRGDAGVDLGERAHQVGDVVVLGLVARRQIGMDVLEIIRRHPFRADAAQRRFPGVHVGVDEARHDDLVGGVDDLVGGGAEVAAGGLDGVAADRAARRP